VKNLIMEMETSFDPVVAMTLNELSCELEKIAHEFEDSKPLVVERVLGIMFQGVTAGFKSPRAILHAIPVDNNINISLQTR
jgi:hypothetical protein